MVHFRQRGHLSPKLCCSHYFFLFFCTIYIFLRHRQTYCCCSLSTHVRVSDEGWFCGPGGLRGPPGHWFEGGTAPGFIQSNSRSVVDVELILRLLSALWDATKKKKKSGWMNLGQQLRSSQPTGCGFTVFFSMPPFPVSEMPTQYGCKTPPLNVVINPRLGQTVTWD